MNQQGSGRCKTGCKKLSDTVFWQVAGEPNRIYSNLLQFLHHDAAPHNLKQELADC
jgi:hypothetical protein